MSLELISFKLCPFVQRSVITLNYKNTAYDITYIDIGNPPDWFTKLSPTGRVPVLKVDGEVLFESAVINEFIDEITPPSLHPGDPLKKAQNRAWIEYGSDLLGLNFQLSHAESEEKAGEITRELIGKLERVEKVGHFSPYFNGDKFSLIDTAWAPLLMRLDLLNRAVTLPAYDGLEGIQRWWGALKELEAVKRSVVEDFESLFFGYMGKIDSYIGRRIALR